MDEVTVARTRTARLPTCIRAPSAVADVMARPAWPSIADRKVNKLSGGQAQRVRFALATAATSDLHRSSTSRPPAWTSPPGRRSGRPCATRRPGPHGPLRHPLPGRGRRRRRPGARPAPPAGCWPTAPPPRSRRKAGARTHRLRPGQPARRARAAAPCRPLDRHVELTGRTVRIQLHRRRRHRPCGLRARRLPPAPRGRRARPGAGLPGHHGRRGGGGGAMRTRPDQLEITARPAQPQVHVLLRDLPAVLLLLIAGTCRQQEDGTRPHLPTT